MENMFKIFWIFVCLNYIISVISKIWLKFDFFFNYNGVLS